MNVSYKYDTLSNHNHFNDPFDLGNSAKRLQDMNHQINLSNYAEELVANYAKYSYDQYELSLELLPENEQNELARLYIEYIDREIEYACYGDDESINSDFLCAMLSMLKDDCKETREKFAEVTRKNLLTYYSKSLEEILDEACENYLHAINNEQGLYACQDMEHGDIMWSKFK